MYSTKFHKDTQKMNVAYSSVRKLIAGRGTEACRAFILEEKYTLKNKNEEKMSTLYCVKCFFFIKMLQEYSSKTDHFEMVNFTVRWNHIFCVYAEKAAELQGSLT